MLLVVTPFLIVTTPEGLCTVVWVPRATGPMTRPAGVVIVTLVSGDHQDLARAGQGGERHVHRIGPVMWSGHLGDGQEDHRGLSKRGGFLEDEIDAVDDPGVRVAAVRARSQLDEDDVGFRGDAGIGELRDAAAGGPAISRGDTGNVRTVSQVVRARVLAGVDLGGGVLAAIGEAGRAGSGRNRLVPAVLDP
ncbi:MAG: hypothetical protein FD129_3019 [bacterium]|nr:MAG: hypothetical protein FD129_3019 [bacterium]